MHDTAFRIGRLAMSIYSDLRTGSILEIGAQAVNGSLRDAALPNTRYVGLDIADGPGVDLVVEPGNAFPVDENAFDLVIASSVFEHDPAFWMTFLEMCRKAKDGGYVYINAPSNGAVHRYPQDNWRFYPDSARALVQWAISQDLDVTLMESFIANRENDIWNDFVAVFRKGPIINPLPKAFIHEHVSCTNVITWRSDEVINPTQESEDMVLIRQARISLEETESALREREVALIAALDARAVLESAVAELREKAEVIANELTAIEAAHAQQRERASALEQQHAMAVEQAHAERNGKNAAEQDPAAIRSRVDQLSVELEDARARLSQSDARLAEASDALSQRNHELAHRESELRQREEEIQQTRAQLEEARAAHADIHHRLERAMQRQEELGSRIDEADRAAADAAQQRDTAERRADDSQRRLEQECARRTAAEASSERWHDRTLRQFDELAAVRRTLDSVGREREGLQAQVTELHRELDGWRSAVDEVRGALENAHRQSAGETERHAAEIAAAEAERARISEELAGTESALSDRIYKIEELSARLSLEQSKAEYASAQIEWLCRVNRVILKQPWWTLFFPRAWRRKREEQILRRKGLFDGRAYLESNPDVATERMDPLYHYLIHGIAEQRVRAA